MYDVYELFLVMFLTKSDHATEILESIPYKVYTYRLVYQFKAIKNRYTPIAALEHPATVPYRVRLQRGHWEVKGDELLARAAVAVEFATLDSA